MWMHIFKKNFIVIVGCAMQCNAMQCNAMQCNAMQCNAMQCNAMQCNAMQCNAMNPLLTMYFIFLEADPYCLVKCERKQVKTMVVSNSQNPEWNTSAIFHRRKPDKPIKISVWNKNTLTLDGFIGQATIQVSESKTEDLIVELFGRRNKKEERVQGQVKVLVETFTDLEAI
jgi:hypothetical protein